MSEAPERIAWLHVGLHKTGTTWIQRSLRRGREALAAQGVGTPDLGPDPGWPLVLWAQALPQGGTGAAAGAGSTAKAAADRAALRTPEARAEVDARMDALIEDAALRALILSAEQFAAQLRPRHIRALRARLERAGWQVRAVAYVRAPLDYAASMIAQSVKSGALLSRRLADPPTPQARRRLGPWLQALGPEAVALRRYDAAAFPDGDVLRDFARTLGAPDLPLPRPDAAAANPRPGAWGLAALDLRNRLAEAISPGLARRRPPRAARLALSLGGPPFVLPDRTAALVAERSAEDEAWLDARLAAQARRAAGDAA
ncbi:MAG: hypothetical protein AAF192_10950 [Pseudomonadota bacterium]